MNIFIMLAILLANLIAITLIYQFVKKLSQMDKIIFIVANFALIYAGVSISYWISGFQIDNELNEALKSFITYTFVPVNVIILSPFVAVKYNKWKQKEIDISELIKRIVIILIIGIIILTIETIYFKKIKEDISELGKSIQLGPEIQEENGIELENRLYENTITNSVSINEITNTELTNEVISNINVTD